MLKEHCFTIRVEQDLLRVGQFRWTLCEFGQVRDQSQMSFVTKSEAEAAATKVLDQRIERWRGTNGSNFRSGPRVSTRLSSFRSAGCRENCAVERLLAHSSPQGIHITT